VCAESGIFTAFVLLAEEAPDRRKNPAQFVPEKQTSANVAATSLHDATQQSYFPPFPVGGYDSRVLVIAGTGCLSKLLLLQDAMQIQYMCMYI
jgi:hypothetical protein